MSEADKMKELQGIVGDVDRHYLLSDDERVSVSEEQTTTLLSPAAFSKLLRGLNDAYKHELYPNAKPGATLAIDSPKFIEWVKTNAGIKLYMVDYGFTPNYEIVDEQQYLLTLLKYR